ncbi:ATP-dependent DNA ligase [Volepox virus]|uniref:DNA ligase n=1 Tax=Volepox virus TaxID=28874 RepID=A0A1C9KCK1_9POXV|nr:ATP-dependent DNA ligase [Volepox virus]AOP31861.1 ATP-dependent DNA ligase [Volepox virus]
MTSFRDFRKLCCSIYHASGYTEKSKIIKDFITDRDDTYLIIKLLLPGLDDRIYNMNDKQIIKLYSIIFKQPHKDMLQDLGYGYIGDTIRTFFKTNSEICPRDSSVLTLQEVDSFLTSLSSVTKESHQIKLLTDIASVCTCNDLKCIVMLIAKDLKIKAGPRYVLNAISPHAYDIFRKSNDLKEVIDNASKQDLNIESVSVSVMIPINPMLAESCDSVNKAFKKFPSGMFAEVKYDGERVQVHKNNNNFAFFSRNMKPVLPHKVDYLKEYLPKAFKKATSIILDSEIVLVDEHNVPLPFGSLGIHKKKEYKNANMCLFVFDCLYFDGFDMTDIPLVDRRSFLTDIMTEIPNRIVFSESTNITNESHLTDVLEDVLTRKLEGLVLKDINGMYEPGKRRWLKIKRDYLNEGSMADSADLVVLGAYYGKGTKGGMMAVFLMGCYDDDSGKWKTVTKCSGHDDNTLRALQDQLKMIKINKNPQKIPEWLVVNKIYIPDFVVEDPKQSPIWEISGAEFTSSKSHTANGISIRFPRFTRIRDDKTWKESTHLNDLIKLAR